MNQRLNFNARRNTIETAVILVINAGLTFWTYRLTISFGGITLLGVWATLQTSFMFARLTDAGLGGATTYFIGKLPHDSSDRERREIVDTTFLLNSIFYSFIAFIGYVGIRFYWSEIFSNNAEPTLELQAFAALPYVAITCLLAGTCQPLIGALNGLHKAYIGARLTVAGTVAQIIVAPLLIAAYGIMGLAISQIVQNLIIIVGAWIMILAGNKRQHLLPFPVYLRVDLIRRTLSYSVRLQITQMSQNLFEPISKVIALQFGGLNTIGLYELALKTVSLPRAGIYVTNIALQGALSYQIANDIDGATHLYKTMLRRTIYAATGSVFGLILLAPIASYFWFQTIELNYFIFTAIMGAGCLINSIAAPANVIGLASGKFGVATLAHLVTIFVMAVAAYPMYAINGAYGVALASSLGLIANAAFLKIGNEQTFRRLKNNRAAPTKER